MVSLFHCFIVSLFKKAIIFLAVFIFGILSLASYVFAQEKKIIIANGSGQIIFYNLDGSIISSFYLPDEFNGLVNLAVGDVDGDFENEIVVASKINGSNIAIFSENGVLKKSFSNSPGQLLLPYNYIKVVARQKLLFVAFDPFYKGRELTLGDLDADGKAEIIVASPTFIEIFNYRGKLKEKFVPFSKNFRGEIEIAAGDIDRDRKDELIFIDKNSPSEIFIREGKEILSAPFPFSKKEFFKKYDIAFGDLEGDGRDELGACSLSAGGLCQIANFKNHQGKTVVKWPNNLIVQDEIFFDLKDVDTDGRAEAIAAEAFGGRISIYKINHQANIWKTIYTLQNISDADVFSTKTKVQAGVIYVDDGDTIFLDNGQEIRYIGVDTPEINQPFYLEATNKNKELIYGRKVTLEYDKQKIDPFGRYLAYIFADGKFVNEELLKAGLAKTEFIYPNVKYADRLLEAEKETKKKKAGIGLWK